MHPHHHSVSSIEILESRIAPAVLIAANGKTATFTDVDGDKVTITISKGDLHYAIFGTEAAGLGEQLQRIDFDGRETLFDGANLTIKAVRTAGVGDGRVNVGYIDASFVNLGAVVVPGDLGRIDVGTNSPIKPALKSLTVDSMGRFGVSTQTGGDLDSTILGNVGTILVKSNMKEAAIDILGNLTSITVTGSLTGGAGELSGSIKTSGDVGTVKIGGDVIGASGDQSGRVIVNGKLGTLYIGGSVFGGTDAVEDETQQIRAVGDIGTVTILGDVIGGSADRSGGVESVTGGIKSLTIYGDVISGTGVKSGSIYAAKDIGTLKILGNLQSLGGEDSGAIRVGGKIGTLAITGSVIGGSAAFDTNENLEAQVYANILGTVTIGQNVIGGDGDGSGRISSASGITSVTIKGSVIGGDGLRSGSIASTGAIGAIKIGIDLKGDDDFSSGSLESPSLKSVTVGGSIRGGLIYATETLGTLVVKGNVLGTESDRAKITAPGSSINPVAIKSITIGGNVEFADILAGYTIASATNGDAQIGTVTVGGDWIASNLIAGAKANAGGFGDADDEKINDGGGIVSKIGSIIIKGQAFGTVGGVDHYGFVAKHIGAFKVGGTTVALKPNAFNDTGSAALEIGATGDLTIREIPA